MNPVDPEIALFVDEWRRCLTEKDVSAAARLLDEGYRGTLPTGEVLTRDAELALLASPAVAIHSVEVQDLRTTRKGNRATAAARLAMTGMVKGTTFSSVYHTTFEFRRTGSGWRATRSRVAEDGAGPAPSAPRARARSAAAWLKRFLRRADAPASFQELAYLPFRPGEDFALPPMEPVGPRVASADDLPVPPRELWLGYNYPAHGQAHVRTMLDVAYASGLTFAPNDRILDLGCGAGRMIRHLVELAATCEIWGMDISAEHIFWCRANLSPPFHFATSTKVPHLPFEDRSFRFVYCGSLFTHIDDLADAWLLELHRILALDGRLYMTIHDSNTVRLFDGDRYPASALARRMRTQETYQRAKDSLGMVSIGRDHLSQVFYGTEYFARMAGSMFEVLSVVPEAYFYQTAFLLRRKQPGPVGG
ncbi:MAG: methyltransferase domain-containing protein [Gemmatimonadetes bacterium]|nr:methyltransferase domain-containing protein [Gemmatimonadota bacterium]